jgi:outer membrane lipoprotein-sorting protein
MKPILILLVLLSSLCADDLLARITKSFDDLYKSSSAKGTMTMFIRTPNWERTMTMQTWSKGTDFMLVKILTPAKDRGVGTLKVKNKMWNYLPKTSKVILVPPSMMMGGWMGSDVTNDDLVGEYTLAEDYNLELLPPDPKEPGVRHVKCTPKEGREIIWGFILIAVDEKTLIPIRQRNFDEKRRLMRTMYFKNVKVVGGKKIPTVIEVIPENKPGQMTRITYTDMQFDIPMEDLFFTLTRLREPIKE